MRKGELAGAKAESLAIYSLTGILPDDGSKQAQQLTLIARNGLAGRVAMMDCLRLWSAHLGAAANALLRSAAIRNASPMRCRISGPQNIMTCYGYRFPPHAFYDWQQMAGTIRLRGHHGRSLLLDLSYRDLPDGEVAMRLAVDFDDVGYEPSVLPDIKPMATERQLGAGSRAIHP